MTDITKILEKMQEMFGDRLVDPDVFPLQFKHQIQLAKYEMFLNEPKEENGKDV